MIGPDYVGSNLIELEAGPKEARWLEVKKATENIGVALDKAFAAIERENTSLEGVMTATKFGDKEKPSDEVLQRLLRHFNQHSLKNRDLYTPDLLGDVYEYLIKQFADDAGKKGGEFYSPRGVGFNSRSRYKQGVPGFREPFLLPGTLFISLPIA